MRGLDVDRRADDRGHADGAFNLGVLLERRGDLKDAEASFRRADDRGAAGGAFNLGLLLEQRGDLKGAEAAWRRALERATSVEDTVVAEAASRVLRDLHR